MFAQPLTTDMDKFKASLTRFLAALEDPAWTQESGFIIYDFQHAVEQSNVFVEKEMHIEERIVVATLEWIGDGKSINDVSKDFWKLYGEFGEKEQFISCIVEPDSIAFSVITGNLLDDTRHGHVLLIHIIGSQVKQVVGRYFELVEENQRLAAHKYL